jgi:hypothetical protein
LPQQGLLIGAAERNNLATSSRWDSVLSISNFQNVPMTYVAKARYGPLDVLNEALLESRVGVSASAY